MTADRLPLKIGATRLHQVPGLRRDFAEALDVLILTRATVDLWLVDIAAVLDKNGYKLEIYEKEAAK